MILHLIILLHILRVKLFPLFCYHSSHFLAGFICELVLHENASAKSFEFEMAAKTLKI